MADGIQFTKADLEGLGLRKDIVDAVFEGIQPQQKEIDRIYQIGLNLEQLISYYVKTNQKTGGYSKVKYSTENNRERVQNIMFIGTQFIFELRSFLLDDEIQFWLGGEYVDDNGVSQLAEKRLKQDQMLKDIRASLSSKAMLLKGELDNFKANEVLLQQHSVDLNAIWQDLLEASDTMDFSYTKGRQPDLIMNNRSYYQNPNRDTNMYVKYSTAKHIASQYYLLDGALEYFNTGWLWEWVRGLSLIEERITQIEQQIFDNPHPIALVFQGRDSIAGIKGGDFVIGPGRGSAQAKYGNHQIITFTSIISIIKQINAILIRFKASFPNETTKYAQQLYDLFIDESLASSLTMNANATIERMLENLNKFATT